MRQSDSLQSFELNVSCGGVGSCVLLGWLWCYATLFRIESRVYLIKLFCIEWVVVHHKMPPFPITFLPDITTEYSIAHPAHASRRYQPSTQRQQKILTSRSSTPKPDCRPRLQKGRLSLIQTFAYDCLTTPDELKAKRKEFWCTNYLK